MTADRDPGGGRRARRLVVLALVVLVAAVLGRLGSGLEGPAGDEGGPAPEPHAAARD